MPILNDGHVAIQQPDRDPVLQPRRRLRFLAMTARIQHGPKHAIETEIDLKNGELAPRFSSLAQNIFLF
jgi:hypothetical protein